MRDARVTSLESSVYIDRVPILLRSDERDTRALVARTSCTASSVHVVFHMVRGVVIDDEFELFDIEASCRNRRSNDDRDNTRFEVGDGGVAVDLIFAAVKRHAQVTFAHELTQEVVGRFLAIDEDKRAALGILVVSLSQDLEQAVELRVLVPHLDYLVDLRCDHGATSDSDLERLVENLACERVHLFRECGGEEDGLTIRADVVDDLHDLRLEPHVEHSVSLVENEVCDTLEVGDPARIRGQEVNHTSWCTDDDFRTLLHFSNLILDR